MVKRVPQVFLWLLLVLPVAAAGAATIQVQVDRNPVSLDQSFQLLFTASGSVDGDPDFAPLQNDFDILSTNQSSSLNIINGSMNRTTQWALTLMAKRAGSLSLPAIAFGADRSQPVTLQVLSQSAPQAAGAAGKAIYLEATVDRDQGYVQAQILYTVRLFRSVNVASATLSEPQVQGGDCLMQKLGDDRTFEQLVNGVRYLVTERVYALFPQASGKLTLDPILFEGQVLQGRSRFDPFGQTGSVTRQRSNSLTLQIVAAPAAAAAAAAAAGAAGAWLPAAAVTLEETWSVDPAALQVGEPVTRTITLRGVGVTAAQLPGLSLQLPPSLKVYPDQPETDNQVGANGSIGVRCFKYAIIPTVGGSVTVPPVQLPWWNTTKDRSERATLPGRSLSVAAAAAAPATPPVPTATAGGQGAAVAQASAAAPSPAGAGLWPWLSLALGLGWAASLGLCWWRRGRPGQNPPPAPASGSESRLAKAARAACRAQDPLAAKAAVLAWGRVRFARPDLNQLGSLARHCPAPLAAELSALQQALYGRQAGPWSGDSLAALLAQETGSAGAAGGTPVLPSLPPLYPE